MKNRPVHSRHDVLRRRSAFTLLELLLVLALVVIVYSLAAPALRSPIEFQRLEKGAEQVRVEWTRARNFAMRSGRTVGFQYQPSTGTYRVQDWSLPGEWASVEGDPLPTYWQKPCQLPEGIVVESATIDDSRSQYVYADPQRAASGDGQWSQPILFFPDGTCSDASLTVASTRADRIELMLRGLTGTSRRNEVEQGEGI